MDLFDRLWQYKNTGLFQQRLITATLQKDVDAVERTIPKGTKVRLWMVSRFGDVGITDNLGNGALGYCARVGGTDGHRNPGTLESYLGKVNGLPGLEA